MRSPRKLILYALTLASAFFMLEPLSNPAGQVFAQGNYSYGRPRAPRPVIIPEVPRSRPETPTARTPVPTSNPSGGSIGPAPTGGGSVRVAQSPEGRPSLLGLVEDVDYTPNIVIVRLELGSSVADIAALLQSQGLTILESHGSGILGAEVLRLQVGSSVTLEEAIEALPRDVRVRSAQPEYIFKSMSGHGGHATAAQYAFQVLQIEQAHSYATGKGINVAIIDTGIDITHPEFDGARLDTFIATDGHAYTGDDHGSQIAGVIAARGTLLGMAPDAHILSAQAFWREGADELPKSTTIAILKSLDWAFESGAQIFNLSFAGAPDSVMAAALSELDAKGAILIAAAGNGGQMGLPAFPGSHGATLAVTATGPADDLYDLATQGVYVDIAAPGIDILAPQAGGRYGTASGTSVAAAFASGAAALLLENDATLTNTSLKALLRGSAVDLGVAGRDDAFGAGRLDVLAGFALAGN